MSQRGKNKENRREEHEDLLAIVNQLRAVPRMKPRPAFRLKVSFFSLLPLLLVFTERRTQRERRKISTSQPKFWKVAAVIAVSLSIVIITFTTLTLAARSSKPGDTLYALKKARENLSLALTFSKNEKARKYINQASERLSEVDTLIAENDLDPEKIRKATDDYKSKMESLYQIIQKDGDIRGAGEIEKQVNVLKTAEQNIMRRLASTSPQSTLLPAQGASVKIEDTSKANLLCQGRSIQGFTDRNGEFEFEIDAGKDKGSIVEKIGKLDVTVELDGRKQICTLGKPAEKNIGTLSVKVELEDSLLNLGKPKNFVLTILDGKTPLKWETVRLRDSSRTSTINGIAGDVFLTTDQNGRIPFTVTKTSLDSTTRIELALLRGGERDLGEILVLGGLEATHAKDEVKVTLAGNANSPNRIEMDNGIIGAFVERVPGRIIGQVVGETGDLICGPVEVPSMAGSKVTSLRLKQANENLAEYEIEFESDNGEGVLRRVYTVSLSKGESFLRIGSIEEGNEGTSLSAQPQETIRVGIPAGGNFKLSGKDVPTSTIENEFLATFTIANPYVAYEMGRSSVVLACPTNSEVLPESWTISRNSLGVMTRTPGTKRLGMILAICDKEKAGSVIEMARKGIQFEDLNQAKALDGFAVRLEPDIFSLSTGRQKVKLVISKKYKTIFDP